MNGSRTRSKALVAIVAFCALLVSSCASIPTGSDPKIVDDPVQENGTQDSVPNLPRDLDPTMLVRHFVDHAAAPAYDYAAARQHLTGPADREWQPPSDLLVVDNIDTNPVPSPPGMPETERMVSLRVDKVGRLKADRSFVPLEGQLETQVHVLRDQHGQWRIADPPTDLIVSRKSFRANYEAASIYFLDSEHSGVVPDRRYVSLSPMGTRPNRVIDLLTSGASEGLRSAMTSALPEGVRTNSNVSEDTDGALVVDFRGLQSADLEQRKLIAAQVVLSLQSVTSSRVRILVDGTPLIENHPEWRPSDVNDYVKCHEPRAEVPALAIVDERLRYLDRAAAPIPGPAGSGELNVVEAGESCKGKRLAVVARRPEGGVSLRIGPFGGSLTEVALTGSTMSRPRWRTPQELWTVVDHHRVVRVLGRDGNYVVEEVDIGDLGLTTPIHDFRLSRDGTRAAAVIDGRIVVSGVSVEKGRAVLRRPVVLTGGPKDVRITGLEWLSDDQLVAITDSAVVPVTQVTSDGFDWISYKRTNLTQPVFSVTVGPGQRVVVAGESRLWWASSVDELWKPFPANINSTSIPFYPG